MNEQPSTLTPKKAASYLGISEAALRLWRSEGRGPSFFRAGEKLIRYRRADLDLWIEARLVDLLGQEGTQTRKVAECGLCWKTS